MIAGVLLLALVAGCGGGDDGVTVTSELAPIEAVEVRVAESFPPQYFLDVTSGLPSGCATFDRYDLKRASDTIEVAVWNRLTVPANGACTTIYGMVEHSIPLGTDFRPGQTYTVYVNSVTRTFVAQ